MGKGDSRLHSRTQADADTMAAKWERTFQTRPVCDGETQPALTDAERDAMWRVGTHIQRGRDT